ncbi:MAG: YggT family protein [Actinomycetota bacterium]|nr:YggT family protein [Actinomycetota bacterium]MDQ5808861.1 YggT family protein [Actinomycetota bacterium]
MIVATVRSDVADFLSTLIWVYVLILLAYIVVNLIFAFGARPGYYRWLDAVLTFLRDVSEPYLSIFRRFIPPLGPIDLSPIVAIFALQILGGIIVGIIRG